MTGLAHCISAFRARLVHRLPRFRPPCTITGTYPDGFLSFTDSSIGIGTFTINGTLTTQFVGTIVDNGLNENLGLTCSSGTNCTFTLLSEHYPVCGVAHPCSGTGEFDVVISEPSGLSMGITGLLALLLLHVYRRRIAVPSKARQRTFDKLDPAAGLLVRTESLEKSGALRPLPA